MEQIGLTSSKSLLRIALIALVAFALALGGALLGANLWPRVVRVERQVIGPAVAAVSAPRGLDTMPDMIASACPAIVAIARESAPAPTTASGRQARRGASASQDNRRPIGFLVSADGYVLTSARDLGDTGSVRVMLNDGRSLEARRAGADPLSGLALLKIEGEDFPFLQFAATDLPRVGQWGVALAAPNASGCVAQAGIVGSDFIAEGARRRNYVRMRPALDNQFEGAPVLAQDGRVIGIGGLGAPTEMDEAAATLLPAATADRVVSALLRSGRPPVNPFGIAAQDLTPALAARISPDRQQGAAIALVEADSPADRAGLEAGDVIFAVDGAPIAGASELGRALDVSKRSVTLDVMRRAERLSITIRAP